MQELVTQRREPVVQFRLDIRKLSPNQSNGVGLFLLGDSGWSASLPCGRAERRLVRRALLAASDTLYSS
jgi:hypothetical protein